MVVDCHKNYCKLLTKYIILWVNTLVESCTSSSCLEAGGTLLSVVLCCRLASDRLLDLGSFC